MQHSWQNKDLLYVVMTIQDMDVLWNIGKIGDFLERKKGYDAEIGRLEQEISDAGLAERIDRDADGEARERADVARSFLDVGEMTEGIWEQFVKGACVYPDGRIEVRWNFGM